MKDPFTWLLEARRKRIDDARWFLAGLTGVGTGLAFAGPSWWQRGVGVAMFALGVGVYLRMRGRPRHRVRTALRIRLPYVLSDRIAKGRTDCGAHEWYLSGGTTWHCYHCVVGVKTEER